MIPNTPYQLHSTKGDGKLSFRLSVGSLEIPARLEFTLSERERERKRERERERGREQLCNFLTNMVCVCVCVCAHAGMR